MGLITDFNAKFIDNPQYTSQYQATTYNITDAVVEVPQRSVMVQAATVTKDEVESLLGDLDSIYRTRANQEVAAIVAEVFPSILAAMRWVKSAGSTGEYVGPGAVGSQLIATQLRPTHIGQTIMTNSAATASTGLYGGQGGASVPNTFSWLPATAWTAGTHKHWFPSQTMAKESAIVFCGISEPEEIPKVDAVSFVISGISTPIMTLNFTSQLRNASRDPVVAKLPKPVIFGPQKLCESLFYPAKTGDSQPTPIAILITMGQNLVL